MVTSPYVVTAPVKSAVVDACTVPVKRLISAAASPKVELPFMVRALVTVMLSPMDVAHTDAPTDKTAPIVIAEKNRNGLALCFLNEDATEHPRE